MVRYFNPDRFDCHMAIAPAGIGENNTPNFFTNEKIRETLRRVVRDDNFKLEMGTSVLPMALRWFVHPELGFPSAPFQVYRRHKRNGFPKKKPITSFQRNGNAYYFPADSYYNIQLSLQNTVASNTSVVLTLLDHRSEPITSSTQTYNLSANQTIVLQFTQPNIKGVQLTNNSNVTLSNFEGMTMTDFLNDPKWELSQIVGLPFKKSEPKPDIYGDVAQGYVNFLTDGVIAAFQRAAIGSAFYKDPNFLQPDGTLLPTWKIPNPPELIDAVRKTAGTSVQTGILFDIYEMLTEVIGNDPKKYLGLQKRYFKTIKSKGISDGGNAASQDGVYQNYVCSTGLLGTATDMWLSLALGFGTMEFPAFIEQLGGVILRRLELEYDYMVTAVFSEPNYDVNFVGVPPFWTYEPKFDGFKQTEYATIAHLAPNFVETPTNLTTANITSARPPVRDQPFVEDTLIEWTKPQRKTPTAYALAVKDKYLNQTRVFLPSNHQPFVGADRADGLGTANELSKFRFVHPKNPLPFIGAIAVDYYLAAMDVFGRWSNWAKVNRVLVAKSPQNAQVIQAQFLIDASDTSDHTFPATLEMTIAWDWDDRSPLDIDIAGQFVPIPSGIINPDTLIRTALMPKNNTGGAFSDYSIGFTGADTPFMTTSITPAPPLALNPSEATVVEDLSDNIGSMTRKYKVRINGFTLNFENTSRLAFGIYVRAREKTNALAWTDFTIPTIVIANDPLPRVAPPVAPDIRWASLSDASNTSRYYLSFASIPHVAGYVVYRATETALRDKAGLPQIVPSETLEDRTIVLRNLSINTKRIAKDAFIRLNQKLILEPNLQVELNGDVDGLYIYALTSMTPENQESDFSGWAYVAVPRRFTPRPPALSGFVKKLAANPNQCELVIDIELPQGTKAQKIELFRTTRQSLSTDIDLMGLPIKSLTILPLSPAVIASLSPDCEAFDAEGRLVTLPNQVITRLRIHDKVSRSWLPNYYRVVTYGEDDRTKGKYPGRSKSSNLLEISPLMPDTPPSVRDAQLAVFSATLLRLTFKTNVPIQTSPFGNHHIALQRFDQTTQIFGDWSDKPIPEIPKKQATDVATLNVLRRTTKTLDGFWEFETFVEYADAVKLNLAVIDPKGRKNEQLVIYTKPAVIKPKIVGAVRVRLFQTLEIRFASNISNKPFEEGAYTLTITRRAALLPIRMLSVDMSQIPNESPFPSPFPIIRLGIVSIGRVIVGGEKLTGYVAAFKLTALDTWGNDPITITITDPTGRRITATVP